MCTIEEDAFYQSKRIFLLALTHILKTKGPSKLLEYLDGLFANSVLIKITIPIDESSLSKDIMDLSEQDIQDLLKFT